MFCTRKERKLRNTKCCCDVILGISRAFVLELLLSSDYLTVVVRNQMKNKEIILKSTAQLKWFPNINHKFRAKLFSVHKWKSAYNCTNAKCCTINPRRRPDTSIKGDTGALCTFNNYYYEEATIILCGIGKSTDGKCDRTDTNRFRFDFNL